MFSQEKTMRIYNDRHHSHADRAHAEMSGEARMGLLLALIGLIAFGAYTAFFLAGLISDLAH